jgi:hypothetical protein
MSYAYPVSWSRSYTITREDCADPNGIKTSIASSTSAAHYDESDLNGASVDDDVAIAGVSGHALPQYPTVTTAAASGAYVPASKVTFTGTYNGVTVTREATLTAVNGGETLLGDGPLDDGPLDDCTEIDVEAQADTDGFLEFGWTDIACPQRKVGTSYENRPFNAIEGTEDGAATIEDADGNTNALPITTSVERAVEIYRIHAAAAVPTADFILYHL